MKKGRPEFFEVFRRAPEEKEPTTWWRKSSAAPAAESQATPSPTVVNSPPRRDAAPAKQIVLTLRREWVVIFPAVFVFMLLGAFVWGRASVSPEEVAVAASARDQAAPLKMKALDIPAPTPAPAYPYYTLRILGGNLDPQNAQKLKAEWRGLGYDAFVLVSRGSYSVNVGRFASYQSSEAKAFKEKVNNILLSKNSRWSSSWQSVTGKGSVER